MNKQPISRIIVMVTAVLMMASLALFASAQDAPQASMEVIDQLSTNGTVLVPRVVADGPSLVVISADNGAGAPGAVIGYTAIGAGEYKNLSVTLDAARMTPTLFAALHMDDNQIGVYEFGSVEGADAPLTLDGTMLSKPFAVQAILARDQIVKDQVMIDSVTVPARSWVVIHAGDEHNFGQVIGRTLVRPGTTANVIVRVPPALPMGILWPMLHADTGISNRFEFEQVEGADLPLVMIDKIATLPISTTPVVRVAAEQLILDENGVVAGDTASVVIGSVLSDGPGFLAVHSDEAGSPGATIGFTPIPDGLSRVVTIDIDPALVTPNLWVMLHKDDHEIGAFEFGSVEEADLPAMVNGQMVSAPVRAAPFMKLPDKLVENNQLLIDRVLIDQPGFVVIHEGDPLGPVLAEYPLQPGLNEDISIELDVNAVSEPIFPALHADTNAIGTLEFGSADGVDAPLMLNGKVIAAELNLSQLQLLEGCTVLANVEASLYAEPNTGAAISGSLAQGGTITVIGQVQAADGLVWWKAADNTWIPSDVASEQAHCENLPVAGG